MGKQVASRPTVTDVARIVGVSPSTVSRALGDHPERVAESTRTLIVDAARNLGYAPNLGARHLSTGRWDSIGFVVPDIHNPYFSSILKGVQAESQRAGLSVFVADSDEDAQIERVLVDRFAQQVDALVLCSPRMSDSELGSIASQVPVVLINRQLDGLPSVCLDEAQIVRYAIEHLHALGHRHIAYIRGPEASWTNARRQEALAAIGEEHDELRISTFGPYNPVYGSGPAAADLIVAAQATALVACNDLVAMGAMARLQHRGIRIPDDFSVVGIDDTATASMVSPALSSVHTPNIRLGRIAMNLAIEFMQTGQPRAILENAHIELRVRDSSSVLAPNLTPAV